VILSCSSLAGAYNAITDVAGVKVGHTTLREGDRVRTGVTAIGNGRVVRAIPIEELKELLARS
jgi:L-aminopeptidase/D-esterase-like protein